MKPALEALKKKFKEQDEKKSDTGSRSKSFGDMYPFWNIEEGQEAIVRPIPYLNMPEDATNPFIDKLEHVLSINGEDKKIPCLRMYGEECPICALSAKYYAAEGKKSEKGKYYWRDKKSLASVYVVSDPLPPNEETKENDQGKLKLAQFGNQLSGKYEKRLKQLLAKDEIDDLPWDLENGLDFSIIKEMSGGYATYDTSSDFVRKSRSLPADFIASWEPVDLRKYLPANPGLDKVQRMLDAHLTGSEYVDDSTDDASKTDTTSETKTETVAESKKAPATKVEKTEPKTETKVEKEETPVKTEVKEEKVVAEKVTDSTPEEAGEEEDFLAKLRRRSAEKS